MALLASDHQMEAIGNLSERVFCKSTILFHPTTVLFYAKKTATTIERKGKLLRGATSTNADAGTIKIQNFCFVVENQSVDRNRQTGASRHGKNMRWFA